MAENSRKVVVKSSSDVPNHSQETNFMMAGHASDGMAGEGGKDEMSIPKGVKKSKSSGEAAVAGFRQPY